MQKPRIKMVDGWWRVMKQAKTKDSNCSPVEFWMMERAQWWCRFNNNEIPRHARSKTR